MEAVQVAYVVQKALLVHAGTTTAAGAADGSTLVDAGLASLPDYNGLAVIITEGALTGQSRDINGVTTGGTITVTPVLGAQVPAGTNYYILASIPQTAEVAAVKAVVDEIPGQTNAKTFNATALASINAQVDDALNTAVPGSPTADSINERIKTLDDNYTAARAGYLDELAAANLPTDIADIPAQANAKTFNATALASINAEVDTALNTAVPGSPTADSINERIKTLDDNYTAARAGYLDELAAANLPADIDAIKGLVDSGETAGPFSYLDAGGEQDVVEDTAVTRRHIWLEFSNRNMTQTGTFRIYRKIDGTNYDLYAEQAVTVSAGDERAFDAEFTTNQAWKLTYEEGADEGAARDIPFNVITQVIE